ncbi:DUF488 family protein [Occallatibacter savannae]|uniref:DUF488 domain-containing protein n=1 Tax=Occallatibacter savannae TaxID=1002691 RepID=UPI000D68A652|nr:DUF488 domain-containing protein [Occallatibacter savannae]
MEIYSIGFTQKSAEGFFETLRANRIERLLDIRLNNTSQLAGFAKARDLAYFTARICGAEYRHESLLAPTQEILDAFKKQKGDWNVYCDAYVALITDRRVEDQLDREEFSKRTAMLCSEPTPEHCHRRLALEYLESKWGGFEIHHL